MEAQGAFGTAWTGSCHAEKPIEAFGARPCQLIGDLDGFRGLSSGAVAVPVTRPVSIPSQLARNALPAILPAGSNCTLVSEDADQRCGQALGRTFAVADRYRFLLGWQWAGHGEGLRERRRPTRGPGQ